MPLPRLVQETRRTLHLPSPASAHHPFELAPKGMVPGHALDFKLQTRKQDEWCWAAVAVSIAAFADPATAWTQCLLAGTLLGAADCCQHGDKLRCNQGYGLKDALDKVHCLEQMYEGYLDFSTSGPPSPSLRGEIDGGQPVAVRIATVECIRIAGQVITRELGHYIVVYGYLLTDEGPFVQVADPVGSVSDYSFAAFTAEKGYGGGTWERSYTTHRCKPAEP